MNKYHVLLSCGDPKMRQLMSMALGDRGCEVSCAATQQDAITEIKARHFDVVLAGLRDDTAQAMAILSAAKQANPLTIVILAGCEEGHRYDIENLPYQADEILMYPCDISTVWKRVGHCLQELEMKKRDAHCIYSRRKLVGIAQEMKLMTDGKYGAMEGRATARLNGLLDDVYGLIGGMDTVLEPAVADRFNNMA